MWWTNRTHGKHLTHDTVAKLLNKFKKTESTADRPRSRRPLTSTDEGSRLLGNPVLLLLASHISVVSLFQLILTPFYFHFTSLLAHSHGDCWSTTLRCVLSTEWPEYDLWNRNMILLQWPCSLEKLSWVDKVSCYKNHRNESLCSKNQG